MTISHTSPVVRNTDPAIDDLRAELALLREREDGGAVSTAICSAIRDLKVELAWRGYKRGRA